MAAPVRTDNSKLIQATKDLMDAPAPAGHGSTGNPSSPTVPVHRETPRILTGEPTETELLRVNELLTFFMQARSHKRSMVSRWKRNYRMIRNQFWDPSARAAWMPSPQIPEIFPIVDALVSWEGDQSPSYTVAPQAIPHTQYQRFFASVSDDLEVVLNSSYVNNAEELEWAKINWDKYLYGTGVAKTTWDMTLAGGMGDAITKRVDPFAFYPDPSASNMTDANYFVEARRMSVQELDRRWPGTGKLFPNGGSDHDVDSAPTQLDNSGEGQPPRGNPGAIAPATSPRYGPPGRTKFDVTDPTVPGVTVLEFWVREHEQYEGVDAGTGEKVQKTYDTWRVIVVAGDRIIMDEPADNLWSHGQHPYERVVVRDTGEFWGFSLVELLTSPQTAYNRILAAMQHNVELTGNPMLKDVASSQRTQLVNRPGSRVPAANSADATAMGWMQPPRLDSSMANLMNHHLQRMEAIAGLSAIMKGTSPSGRNAQGVIDALQEAGFVRIRSSLKFLEAAMRSAGSKKADLIIENYTTDRIVAIAGPGGERTSRVLAGRRFMLPTEEGATPLRYQLMVDVGSSKHTSRQMREDRAVQLFTLGAIDEEALLSDIDYPNAGAVAERVEKKKAAALMEAPGARQRARA